MDKYDIKIITLLTVGLLLLGATVWAEFNEKPFSVKRAEATAEHCSEHPGTYYNFREGVCSPGFLPKEP